MGYVKSGGMDDQGAADRAYRLQMNTGQVRVDDWSIIGGVLGGVSPLSFLLLLSLKKNPDWY